MDKLTKVRAEVERLHNEYRNKKGALYFRKALRTVLFIIDSMPKEPVSEDLEEVCEQLAENARKHKAEISSPFFSPTDYKQGVIDGANWQKEQIMKKAFPVEIGRQRSDYKCVLHGNFANYDTGDKVKVIIIKEE